MQKTSQYLQFDPRSRKPMSYLEYTISNNVTSTAREMFGFGSGTLTGGTTTYTSVDYSFHPSGSFYGNQLHIYENGTSKGTFGSYTSGDIFKLTMDNNGIVKYYKNNTLIYTSTTIANGVNKDATVSMISGAAARMVRT